jgi:hypothetical protein
LRERAFVEVRKLQVKLAAQDDLEHGVAEEFQSLIVLHGAVGLVRHRGVRER